MTKQNIQLDMIDNLKIPLAFEQLKLIIKILNRQVNRNDLLEVFDTLAGEFSICRFRKG